MVRAKPAKSNKTKRKRRKHALTKLVESERREAREAGSGSNPFEFQSNKRRKRDVFGKKVQGKTNLAAARSAAVERRKDTLLVEYKRKNKANSFVDRRIGEHADRVPDHAVADPLEQLQIFWPPLPFEHSLENHV